MNEEHKTKSDKLGIWIKALTPIFAGLLIAWAGFVSNLALSSISNNQESARLITELQISREQAESELRKDVFDQTLQAFLLKTQKQDDSIKGMSKQLLRLELLALNFGDSLSLSPLFNEFRRDLKHLKPGKDDNEATFKNWRGEQNKRLYSLARQVASSQISSLVQHGEYKSIRIPFNEYDVKQYKTCQRILFKNNYQWPMDKVYASSGVIDDEIKDAFNSDKNLTDFIGMLNYSSEIKLEDISRYLNISISDVNLCEKSAKVNIILYKENKEESRKPIAIGQINNKNDLSVLSEYILDNEDKLKYEISTKNYIDNETENNNTKMESAARAVRKYQLIDEIERNFTLDYFNFPMVNNTRLGNNHRFAIVMTEFDLDVTDPHMELIAIIFPSEYASLRDRPGMEEARKMLESALQDKKQK